MVLIVFMAMASSEPGNVPEAGHSRGPAPALTAWPAVLVDSGRPGWRTIRIVYITACIGYFRALSAA